LIDSRKRTVKNIDADNSVIKKLEAKLSALEVKLQRKIAESFAARQLQIAVA